MQCLIWWAESNDKNLKNKVSGRAYNHSTLPQLQRKIKVVAPSFRSANPQSASLATSLTTSVATSSPNGSHQTVSICYWFHLIVLSYFRDISQTDFFYSFFIINPPVLNKISLACITVTKAISYFGLEYSRSITDYILNMNTRVEYTLAIQKWFQRSALVLEFI